MEKAVIDRMESVRKSAAALFVEVDDLMKSAEDPANSHVRNMLLKRAAEAKTKAEVAAAQLGADPVVIAAGGVIRQIASGKHVDRPTSPMRDALYIVTDLTGSPIIIRFDGSTWRNAITSAKI